MTVVAQPDSSGSSTTQPGDTTPTSAATENSEQRPAGAVPRHTLLDLAQRWTHEAARCPGSLRAFNLADCAAELRALVEQVGP